MGTGRRQKWEWEQRKQREWRRERGEDQEWIADMRSAIHRGSNGRDREEWGKAEAEGEDALSEKLGRKNARPEDEDKV